jgi:hypothetical protein
MGVTLVLAAAVGFALELLIMVALPAFHGLIGTPATNLRDAAMVGALIAPGIVAITALRLRRSPAKENVPVRRAATPTTRRDPSSARHRGSTASPPRSPFLLVTVVCLVIADRVGRHVLQESFDEELLSIARIAAGRLDVHD